MDRKNNAGAGVDNGSSLLDRVLYAIFIVGLLGIMLVGGAFLSAAELFPGPQIARAYKGGTALYQKLTAYQDVYNTDIWNKERDSRAGITVNDSSRAQQGLTLYTANEPAAYLMTMDGEVVHEWRRPFSTVWDETSPIKEPQPDEFVYFRKAMAFPNGDLIALYEGVGDTPYGYGVVKLDRDSNVIWKYFGRAHHGFDIGPDGRIYVLTHEFVNEPLDGYGKLAVPRLDDYLVILSPDGEELQKISLIHTVARSVFQHMIHTVPSYSTADPLHANDVELITEESARNFAVGEAGQVMLSFRELGAIVVLDLDSETVTWAERAYWLGQHDPDILPDGNILLFDNFGNYDRPIGHSRVLEFNPVTMEIVWRYDGTEEQPLDAAIRSDQERQPNGNTLITESNGGRILEVTPSGEIVWEFVHTARGGEDNDRIPIICWAQRIDPASFDEDFRSSLTVAAR